MDNFAEQRFKEWLDKNNIPYWYIDQSLESFSPALRKFLAKRPDFMILLPNVGLIFVDVKDKSQAEIHDKFYIDAQEVDKYLNMQRTFNLQIWFAISHQNYHYKTWFWIPASSVASSRIFSSSKSGDPCYSVPINNFIQVADTDNLNRIFEKLLEFKD